MRVLIVDDDPSVRASLQAYLSDEGFTAKATGSPSEALTLFSNEPIDVAVVDIRLGELTGEMLIPLANAIQATTRFLIFTGSSAYQLSETLTRIGMQSADVLYKPVGDLGLISRAIRRLAGEERNNVR